MADMPRVTKPTRAMNGDGGHVDDNHFPLDETSFVDSLLSEQNYLESARDATGGTEDSVSHHDTQHGLMPEARPSKVIHWRNVGPDISQADLVTLSAPFGTVVQVVLVRYKNQALVEMGDISSAVNLMTYHSQVQACIRGQFLYPQFSSHTELTGEPPSGRPGSRKEEAKPNRVLLVTIHNPMYPITVDILDKVFSRYGVLEKAVMFQKTAGLQALVQFADVETATTAKTMLQGQSIYTGCCSLSIQYSSLQSLTVKHNTDHTRDFTNPDLVPTMPRPTSSTGAPTGIQGMLQNTTRYAAAGVAGAAAASAAVPAAAAYSAPPAASTYTSHATPHQSVVRGVESRAPGSTSYYSQMMGPSSPATDRCVLLVANLNADKVDCEILFNLFSNYGNILRVKILFNKPDHALIQLADNVQSTTAMNYLKGVPLFGKPMDINFSKHSHIASSPENAPELVIPGKKLLVQDYSRSLLNRFLRADSKNFKHICPPTVLLHVSQLSPTVSAETLSEIFSNYGPVNGCKIFGATTRRQALVQFEDVIYAVNALASLHNTDIAGSAVRISFSKNTI